jgi:hypothetical protein
LRVERDPGHASGDVDAAVADKLDEVITALQGG